MEHETKKPRPAWVIQWIARHARYYGAVAEATSEPLVPTIWLGCIVTPGFPWPLPILAEPSLALRAKVAP